MYDRELVLFEHIQERKIIYPGVKVFITDQHIICMFHSSSEGDSTPVNRGVIDTYYLSLTDEERKRFVIFTCFPKQMIDNYWNYLWINKVIASNHDYIGEWRIISMCPGKWIQLHLIKGE